MSRDEIVDARRLGRKIQAQAGTDQEGESKQGYRTNESGECCCAQDCGGGQQKPLRGKDEPASIDDVCQRTGNKPEQQGRRGTRRLYQRDHELGRRQRGHHPGSDGRLHRVTQRRSNRTEVEQPEPRMPQW